MKTIFNKKRWLLTAPLAVLMAGCNIDNNGSSVVAPPAPITPAAVSGISPVNLGAAGNFVILASSGISTVPNSSAVTGDIGTTYAATAITGFSLIADSTKVFSKSAQVTGNVYGFDYAPPTPANLTTAELNMGAAYSDAAGRAPNYTEVGSGNIGGMTLPPAVYKWSSGVLIPTNVTLNGGPNDVWIFQIAGGITQASGTRVLLAGGALSQNIFWQSADVVALGTSAHLEGIVLAKTAITLASSASVNGRLLSQTAVTLIANTVTQPGSVATADTTAPTATSITPANAAVDVAVNGDITATFSEAMKAVSVNTATFTLAQGTISVPSTVTYAGTVATLKPSSALAADTVFTAMLTAGLMDLAGNAMAVKIWSFKTAATPDAIVPTVKSVAPANAAVDVASNADITATFSEDMKPATITSTTFSLTEGTTLVPSVVTYADNIATLKPSSALAADSLFTARLTAGIMDLAGNALVAKNWSFRTAAAQGPNPAHGPAPVTLGSAGNFVILTETGITTDPTSPASVVTGDMGTTIVAEAITGFSLTLDSSGTFSTSALVTGKVYGFNYASPTPGYLTTAVSNMQAAYTDAAGRLLPDFTEKGTAGEIGGLTLVPGLYKWGTGVLISTDVTLNGGPNDVWIFQIAGGITQGPAAQVVLTGGALAKNIFWQSAGVVALDTTAHMEGIVLSKTGITLNSGATVNGRLLAQTAVTLIANTVKQP